MTERLQYKVDWILPGKEAVIGKEIIEVNKGMGQILTLVQQDIDGEPQRDILHLCQKKKIELIGLSRDPVIYR